MRIGRTIASRILFCSLFFALAVSLIWLAVQSIDVELAWWLRLATGLVALLLVVPTGIVATLAIGSFLPANPQEATGVAKALHDALPARGQEFVSGNFRITEHSLHWRIYSWYYYQSDHFVHMPDRPSFCSYFWTVVGKAPLYWFLHNPVFRWVYPWMISLVVALLTMLLLSWLWWPSTTIDLLLILGIILAIGAIIVGIVLLLKIFMGKLIQPWWEQHHEEVICKVLYATAIIWMPLAILIGGPLMMMEELYEGVIKPHFHGFMRWWFASHKWYIIRPFTVGYAIIVLLATLIWGQDTGLMLLTAAGVAVAILVAGGILGATIFGLVWSVIQVMRAISRSRGLTTTVDRGSSMGQMVKEMYQADKQNVCPLLQLPTKGES